MFVGLDVHKNYLQAAAVDGKGMLLKEQRIPNDVREIERFFADIHGAKIVIESSSSWYQIYELLSKRYLVVLSNPVKTKAIASAKVKTDRLDAFMLANLLRGGYIAESYVPPNLLVIPSPAGAMFCYVSRPPPEAGRLSRKLGAL
jgi:hypothetical protein